jgi:2-polyprenyl-6-methoxyphenol hydroxylase-like FAD-dependent oxidoreductase
MEIVCVGAGPAGLYFAILSKLRDPSAEVTVLERNPAGVTHGWGVVFWDDLVESLLGADPASGEQILGAARQWTDMTVQVGSCKPVWLGGYGYSMGRNRLLDVLAAHAASLGVRVHFEHAVADIAEFSGADLVVACDGARSQTRQRLAAELGTRTDAGRNRYVWLGTRHVFDTFTFSFRHTRAGWIWMHAYGFDADTSTCVVECPPETWTGLGLDTADTRAGLDVLSEVFAEDLGGAGLISTRAGTEPSAWLSFAWVRNERWFHDNVVLMGDAAHTTHFSIGSGTKLAVEDAIGLDDALRRHSDLTTALRAYQDRRSLQVAVRQAAARASAAWFENVPHMITTDPLRFAYSLQTRRDPRVSRSGLDWLFHRASQNRIAQAGRRRISSARRRAQWSHVR